MNFNKNLTAKEQATLARLRPIIRNRLWIAGSLSVFLLLLYGLFTFLLGTGENLAGIKVAGEMNLMVLVSLIAIFSGVLISGVYVFWTKKYLDPKLEVLRKE